jgi:hypothetical protein
MTDAFHVHTSDKNIASGFENTGREPCDIVHELVDNAIDAKATEIVISFPTAKTPVFFVQDNGLGMDSVSLSSVFTPGKSNKPHGSIGGYGDGLKSTMGLAEVVSVISQYKKHIAGEFYDKKRMLDHPSNQYVTFTETDETTLAWAKTQFKKAGSSSGTVVRLSHLRKNPADWDTLYQSLPLTLGVKFYSFLLSRQINLTIKKEGHPDVVVVPLDAMDRHNVSTKILGDEELSLSVNGERVKGRLRSFFLKSDSETDPFSKKFSQKTVGKDWKGKFSASQGLRVICNGREVAHIHTHDGLYVGHASTNFFRAELVFSGDIKSVVKPTRDKTKIVLDEGLKSTLAAHLQAHLCLGVKHKKEKLKNSQKRTRKAIVFQKSALESGVNTTSLDDKRHIAKIEIKPEKLRSGFGTLSTDFFQLEGERLIMNPQHPLFHVDGLAHKDWSVIGTLFSEGLSELPADQKHQFLMGMNRAAESVVCTA